MKTLKKISRSTIASLLFLLLTVAIITQFFFTIIRTQGKIPDIIDRDYIISSLNTKQEVPNHLKIHIKNYLDQYIRYIFYKRSYPSIDTLNYGDLNKEEIETVKKILYDIKEQIDISYENVVMIRNINNFLTNGSIYLIINISIFLIFIVLTIIIQDFKKSFKIFNISLFVSSLIILSMNLWIHLLLQNILNPSLYNLIKNSIDTSIILKINNQGFIYMFLSIVLYFSLTYSEKIYLKFQK